MLQVKNISKSYGSLKAVDELTFEVKKGEIFGLLGPNGSGKTTTFRMIMGLLDPDSGEVLLNGKRINYSVTDKIGFLTEERSLLLKLTVREQIIFYGRLKGMTEEKIIEKLEYYLDKFNVSENIDRKIKELSKGNQQKIQFISAILNEPDLLILDEPFSGLDPINAEMFQEEIRELSKKGCAIIFSTHRMEDVELFCKKIVILKNGKNVLSGEIKKIKKDFEKKNIIIKGDVVIGEFKDLKGIVSSKLINEELHIKVENEDIAPKIFEKLKKSEMITKFVVEEPTLNEIFVAKVGEEYVE